MKLEFKRWFEDGGMSRAIEPPVQDPSKLNNGAFPRYDLTPLPGNKKPMKKMKKK